VLIQTCHSDHPLLTNLCQGNYAAIADQLLAEREGGQLPPFRAMAILRAEADTMQNSLALLDTLKPMTRSSGIETWGPLPAVIARKADRHRAQLVLVSDSRGHLNRTLTHLCQHLDQSKLPAGNRWAIDVDPQETG
jgi:primosomal protein N' (replication factor Y)